MNFAPSRAISKLRQSLWAVFLISLWLFLPIRVVAYSFFDFLEGGLGDIVVSDFRDYRILFSWTGRSRELFHRDGKKQKWVEISYKFVSFTEDPKSNFASDGWVAIRLQDKDGFAIATDAIHYRNLTGGREIFGVLWIRKEKAKKLVQGDIKKIPKERIDKILKQNERVRSIMDELDAIEKAKRERETLQRIFFSFARSKEGHDKEEAWDAKPVTEKLSKGEEEEQRGEDSNTDSGAEKVTGEQVGTDKESDDYDPFDDPDRLRNEDVKAFLGGLDTSETLIEDLMPPEEGRLSNKDVKDAVQEFEEMTPPKIEFLSKQTILLSKD